MSDNSKHKKDITESLSSNNLAENLGILVKSIMEQGYKQQHIISQWLKIWSNYLLFENKFNPKQMIYYKRGDIVLAHFGYNVGNELGGIHYAVVIEKNNNISNGIVTVIPLSSLEAGKTKNDLHNSEVFLGKVIGNVDCYAMPLQIRPISKLRIIKPKHKGHGKTTVSGELLDKIDNQIRRIFTKQND